MLLAVMRIIKSHLARLSTLHSEKAEMTLNQLKIEPRTRESLKKVIQLLQEHINPKQNEEDSIECQIRDIVIDVELKSFSILNGQISQKIDYLERIMKRHKEKR